MNVQLCLVPLLMLAICAAFPFIIWAFLDMVSDQDEKDWVINTVLGMFDDDEPE